MARRTTRRATGTNKKPTLVVTPRKGYTVGTLHVRGERWPNCPVKISIGGRQLKGADISCGLPHPEGLQPDPKGCFAFSIELVDLAAGKYRINARSTHLTLQVQASAAFVLEDPPIRIDEDGREHIGPHNRMLDFQRRRFGALGYVPPGVRQTQIEAVRDLRHKTYAPAIFPEDRVDQPGPALPGVCNWTPMGAAPVPRGQTQGGRQAVAGRALSIAIDPLDTNIVYLGTAAGGIWKSTDGGTTWSPKTDFASSMTSWTIVIDPNDNQRIFAGTGGLQVGAGLMLSTDGGETWAELATAIFARKTIFKIIFDPTDATSQRMFVAANYGVYESLDGGANWTQFIAGNARDLVLLVDPAVPQQITLIAAFWSDGLWTSTRAAAVWGAWTKIADPNLPDPVPGRIALAQCQGTPTTIYALLASGRELDRLVVSTDSGLTWNIVPVRLEPRYSWHWSGSAAGHAHPVQVPAADLTAAAAVHTYTSNNAGDPAHSHDVTMTAANISDLAMGRAITVTSDADASGHTHDFEMTVTRQCSYNLVLAVHPVDPNIIYFGEVNLWKNTTGGGVFKDISDGDVVPPPATPIGIHADQHSFAFDPINPNRIWSINDGGVYRSDDAGANWIHRNRDLATLQYNHVSLHPQWETIMLGGTQDNGTHRYVGSPAWEFSDYGDGGFTAINPANTQRCYHGYTMNTFHRSDEAGAIGSWTNISAGITGTAVFYPPFLLDPVDPDICYFGNSMVWRSADGGDTWNSLTAEGALTASIVTMAVDPSDTDKIYVAVGNGSVYLVERTGATWDPVDITLTDISAPDLPVSVYTSDLAVDSTGTVWVTVGSYHFDTPGVFSNQNVYRLVPGSAVWESRSDGLVAANPINTITIDPTNDSRLFCGADIGVYRTDDAGDNWVVWDPGLPNAPVYHLAIHGPTRLLRAATYGRSVWERPIDVAVCPPVDLYMRDSILDSGRVIPSPSGHPNPTEPGVTARWYQSVDIKVDAPEPDFQTAQVIDDFVSFANLEHRSPRRGQSNRFYVQVHNRGVQRATGARVRAFFADASGGLPELPADFWDLGNPFDGDPSAVDWTAIGNTIELGDIEAAEPAIASWEWFIPDTAAAHSCLLAVTTCNEDAIANAGVLNIGWLVRNEKRATLKNLHVLDAVPGGIAPPDEPIMIEFHPESPKARRYDLVLDWGSLPLGARLFMALEVHGAEEVLSATNAALGKLGIKVMADSEGILAAKVKGRCGKIRKFDQKRLLVMARKEPQEITVPNLLLPADGPLGISFKVELPKKTPPGEYQFDVIQKNGKRLIGGSSYRLRVRPRR